MKRFIPAFGLAALLCASTSWAAVIKTVAAGATDQSVTVRIIDDTDGTCETGVVFNTSGIDLEYWIHGANAVVNITEATQTVNGAHTDGGFVEVGHCVYRLDLPDAAVATAGAVEVQGTVTDMIVVGGTVLISPPVNVVSAAGTAWGSGAITAASIATDAIGAAEIAADAIGASELATGAITSAEFASGAITAAAIATDAIGAAEVATDAGTELGTAAWATTTRSLTILDEDSTTLDLNGTAIGSVTGAVASVTGNVGGNVTGSVGSVATGGLTNASFACTGGSFLILGVTDCGTAQSADGTGVVLRTAAAFADDTAVGSTLLVNGSTQGYAQSRAVTANLLTGDDFTVDTWTVTPSGTLTYYLFGTAPGAGGDAPTVSEIWAAGTRTLTALDEDNTTIDLNASYVGGVTVFDEDLTTIDINGTTLGTVTTASTVSALAANSLTAAAAAADLGTELGTAAWASTTRVLTAGTNIALAKGTGVTGFNDLSVGDIWNATLATYSGTSGSTAEALGAAQSAGDPWTTALPGSYTAGQAGYIVGTNLDGTVSTRASQSSVDALPTAAENRTEMDSNSTDLNALMLARTQLLVATADSGDTNTLVDTELTFAAAQDIDGAYVVRSDGQRCFVDSFDPDTDTIEFGACTFTGAWSTQAYKLYPAGTQ